MKERGVWWRNPGSDGQTWVLEEPRVWWRNPGSDGQTWVLMKKVGSDGGTLGLVKELDSLYQLLLCCCDKTPWPGKWRKCLCELIVPEEREPSWQGNVVTGITHGGRSRKLRSQFLNSKKQTEHARSRVRLWALETHPSHLWHTSSSKTTSPKWCLQLETKCSNVQDNGDHSHLNHYTYPGPTEEST